MSRQSPGRPAGQVIQQLASQHGKAAIKRLAWLMEHAKSEATQVAAAKELLERAYGKSTQPVDLDADVRIPAVTAIEFIVVQPNGTRRRVPGPYPAPAPNGSGH